MRTLSCRRTWQLRTRGTDWECCLQEDLAIVYKGHEYALDSILVDKFHPGDLIAPGSAPLLLQRQEHRVKLGKAALAVLDMCQGDAQLHVSTPQSP